MWTRRSQPLFDLLNDTWGRIARSLQTLERFLRRPELAGNWASARLVLGHWPSMILLYSYEESSDRVYVVAMHDGRPTTSATAAQR